MQSCMGIGILHTQKHTHYVADARILLCELVANRIYNRQCQRKREREIHKNHYVFKNNFRQIACTSCFFVCVCLLFSQVCCLRPRHTDKSYDFSIVIFGSLFLFFCIFTFLSFCLSFLWAWRHVRRFVNFALHNRIEIHTMWKWIKRKKTERIICFSFMNFNYKAASGEQWEWTKSMEKEFHCCAFNYDDGSNHYYSFIYLFIFLVVLPFDRRVTWPSCG